MCHFMSSRTNNTNSLSQSEVGIQLFETLGLESEIQLVIKNLKKWAAPRAVEKNLVTLSDTLYIQPEPLGVVLVIGAWNYPWAVTLFPLIGAIAAGTLCVCVCVCVPLCLDLLLCALVSVCVGVCVSRPRTIASKIYV